MLRHLLADLERVRTGKIVGDGFCVFMKTMHSIDLSQFLPFVLNSIHLSVVVPELTGVASGPDTITRDPALT